VKIHKTKDKLPNEGEYVLVWAGNRPWGGTDMSRFWKVAMITYGITEEKREELKLEYEQTGKNEEVEEITGWCLSEGLHKTPRHRVYQAGDVHGNNEVPYEWDEFGPDKHFGQDIKYWAYLPTKEILKLIKTS